MGKMLSLTEEKTEQVKIPDAIWKQSEDVHLMVIGRVLSRKWVNFEALKIGLIRMLNPGKGMTVRSLNDERFLIAFNHRIDKRRAIEGGPWIFDKQLIVLNTIDRGDNPLDICLDKCAFTVFIHDIPYSQRTHEMARHIGQSLGEM
ncbi:hypothetical protein Salat_0205700 [Sesamum alatum]|uniref:DUF4283 domain-containing protein n=1 Tax=Sesamum alatum TaxID=300844 RepID=A0AAE1YZ12_9LAMI|nr:hypothetical protein Salat_0205700 [Sesamum alatum]